MYSLLMLDLVRYIIISNVQGTFSLSTYHKSSIKPPGFIYFLWSWRGLNREGLIREGGLFLTQDKSFIQMVFCIPSMLLPLKISATNFKGYLH